jgi:holo-[acyl-carrier protein] synthase
MIKGLGIDVVELDRFRNLPDRTEFTRQILNDTEIADMQSGVNQNLLCETAFAVKEAVLKALGAGLHHGSYWHEIEITGTGKLRLSGHLADVARDQSVTAIHSSQSYTDTCVVAFVLLEHNDKETSL